MNDYDDGDDEQDPQSSLDPNGIPISAGSIFAGKLDSLTYDELVQIGNSNFGFLKDELKVNYPTEDQLREFLIEAEKARGVAALSGTNEDAIGWDSEDKTPLDDHGKKIVKDIKANREKRLKQSIAACGTGGTITVEDVNKAKEDIRSILSRLDDEDEEE